MTQFYFGYKLQISVLSRHDMVFVPGLQINVLYIAVLLVYLVSRLLSRLPPNAELSPGDKSSQVKSALMLQQFKTQRKMLSYSWQLQCDNVNTYPHGFESMWDHRWVSLHQRYFSSTLFALISFRKCIVQFWLYSILTHWGRVTHICIGKLTSIGSDNGLSPERRQAIIWTNA